MRRWLRHLVMSLVLGCLMIGTPSWADEADLRAFAETVGLDDIDAFVSTVESLREEGWLPDHYVTKDEARDLGWRPGDDLCDVAADLTIGGDRFGNYERLLPERSGRRWYEADLDFDCGRRGARRLVFSDDGLIYVTLDHYESFEEVPE